MFTGIIEGLGTLKNIKRTGSNLHFTIESALSRELKADQSVAHNGVCLTVTDANDTFHKVTAIAETLAKTDLNCWSEHKMINLERAMKLGDRLDGHIVQGHVDATGMCTQKKQLAGSYLFKFSFPEAFAALIIEKGSVCINGVSLTAFDVGKDYFSVTIIPYTFEHTAFSCLAVNEQVNLEFDVLGKYILRAKSLELLA